MRVQVRVLALVATAVLVIGAATGYVVHLRLATAGVGQPASATTLPPDRVLAQPHIVFRSTALGPAYGRLGIVPLARPDGPRALLPLSCERVYATARAGVCVTAKRGVVESYAVATLGPQLQVTASAPLTGLPSRARMSADGSLVATTTFVTGHSYAQSSFSTDTVVRQRGVRLPSLEAFATSVDGHPLRAVNRNFWGVTFAADDDTFYATAASGSTTWLVRGSLSRRRMDSLRTDAECPSLSPDGRHLAYKKRLGSSAPGTWRLAVLDIASGRETLLAETRSVDDQVEWLDDQRVLYGLSRGGTEGTTSDVWVAQADGSGSPRVLVPQASSPAVVR